MCGSSEACNVLREELNLVSFTLRLRREEDTRMLVTSPISCISQPVLLTYRVLALIYLITMMSISIWHKGEVSWIYYLTSFNYMLDVIYFILLSALTAYSMSVASKRSKINDAIVVNNPNTESIDVNILNNVNPSYGATLNNDVEANSKEITTTSIDDVAFKRPLTGIFWAFELCWIVLNVTVNMAILVLITYWGLLYPGYSNALDLFLTVDRHGINTLLVVVDFMICGATIRILHFTFTTGFIALYFFYNIMLHVADDIVVYSKIDYTENTEKSILLIVLNILFAAPVSQCLVFGLYMIKKALFF